MSDVTRRGFLKTTSAVAAATAVSSLATPVPASAAGSNERIRIGFIGPGGRGFGAHVKTLCNLHKEGAKVDLVAAADVYSVNLEKALAHIKKTTGTEAKGYVDYTEMLEKENLDAVCIGTPDHWHATQTIHAMEAGCHVYCEKPMTHSVEEGLEVVAAWKKTGKVMQVGVQSTSLPLWDQVRGLLQGGKLGKVMMYQTEYFRNSAQGQWRYYKLEEAMNPKNIDWTRWLGVKEGLAPERPFDRAVYRQWRRFWDFGSGMYTDLFVHRTTAMLKATGLRFPGRVVGAGGIFMEYDGRDVPDVATVAADFPEGVQGLVSSTMCNQNTRIQQLIRGHFGSFVFGNGEGFDTFQFIPERPQVTRNSKLKEETIRTETIGNTTEAHFKNWIAAMQAGDPQKCNNPPDLGAAAIAVVNLGAQSYRYGKVFQFDEKTGKISDGDGSWSQRWEKKSHARAKPNHIAGWKAGDYGSLLEEPDYMKLSGPWKDGNPPGGSTGAGAE